MSKKKPLIKQPVTPPAPPAAPPAAPLKLAPLAPTRKLDLACGRNCQPGFQGVDLADLPGVQKLDVLSYPWPWADSSVLELHCSHFVEHIPMEYVDRFGNPVRMSTPGAQDALFRFFDECYRVLAPDGVMKIVVPAHRSDRAFQDPTHRRFITQVTFGYLLKEWREVNGLGHYGVSCDFITMSCMPTILNELNMRSPEVVSQKIQHEWNHVIDWVAMLKSRKT